jgi:hypothetical protein
MDSKQEAGWLIGRLALCAGLLVLFVALGGCSRPLMPTFDPDLKKNYMELAADAAKRPYPAEAPRGGEAVARANVDHGLMNQIKIVNLSDQDWSDVDLWVNEQYVIHLNNWTKGQLRKIGFKQIFNAGGQSFPIDNKGARVEKVEIHKDGKLFEVTVALAD